jgi:hypothetical protein
VVTKAMLVFHWQHVCALSYNTSQIHSLGMIRVGMTKSLQDRQSMGEVPVRPGPMNT